MSTAIVMGIITFQRVHHTMDAEMDSSSVIDIRQTPRKRRLSLSFEFWEHPRSTDSINAALRLDPPLSTTVEFLAMSLCTFGQG